MIKTEKSAFGDLRRCVNRSYSSALLIIGYQLCTVSKYLEKDSDMSFPSLLMISYACLVSCSSILRIWCATWCLPNSVWDGIKVNGVTTSGNQFEAWSLCTAIWLLPCRLSGSGGVGVRADSVGWYWHRTWSLLETQIRDTLWRIQANHTLYILNSSAALYRISSCGPYTECIPIASVVFRRVPYSLAAIDV